LTGCGEAKRSTAPSDATEQDGVSLDTIPGEEVRGAGGLRGAPSGRWRYLPRLGLLFPRRPPGRGPQPDLALEARDHHGKLRPVSWSMTLNPFSESPRNSLTARNAVTDTVLDTCLTAFCKGCDKIFVKRRRDQKVCNATCRSRKHRKSKAV
jgi:hypothetical protein